VAGFQDSYDGLQGVTGVAANNDGLFGIAQFDKASNGVQGGRLDQRLHGFTVKDTLGRVKAQMRQRVGRHDSNRAEQRIDYLLVGVYGIQYPGCGKYLSGS
jgi:hypothetical protein